jgi:hypothetical protein
MGARLASSWKDILMVWFVSRSLKTTKFYASQQVHQYHGTSLGSYIVDMNF